MSVLQNAFCVTIGSLFRSHSGVAVPCCTPGNVVKFSLTYFSVCAHVYILRVCMHVYMCVHIYVCMYMLWCVYLFACTYGCVYERIFSSVYTAYYSL